jgi:flagellin-like hook-associated protein FlgL
MRITTNLLFNSALTNIQKQNARLLKTSEEASSGLRLQRPSDDPAGTRRVLDLRNTLSSLDQFKSQRVVANSLLGGTDTALQDTETLLLSAKSLALRAASDTLGPEQRSQIASEVGSLLGQGLALGNSVVNGHYLFAGQANDQPPFAAHATLASTVRSATPSGTLTALGVDDLSINSLSIRATQATDDPLSTVDAAASARAVAAAINAATPSTGVQATAANTTRALTVLSFGDLAGNALTVNGVPVAGTITDAASLVAAVNTAQIPGVVASSSATNNITLTAADGRNIALATDGSAASGLSFLGFNPSGGVAVSETTTGAVTLFSDTAFTLGGLKPGNAGFSPGPVNLTARFRGDNHDITQTIGAGQTLPVNVGASQFLVADLQPTIDRSTPLTSLRQGQGIQPGSIAITDRAGNTATVDLSTAVTIGDVIDTIATATAAAGVQITATFNSANSGLSIVDNNTAPVRNLTITDVPGSTTAGDLGIAADRPGQVAGTPLAPQLTPATSLSLLYGGRGVTLGTIHITNGIQETDVDLSTARTIGDVLGAINTSTAGVQATFNTNGTALAVHSTNSATVAVVTEVGSGQSAATLGLGGHDTLKTLSLLQEALQKNDTPALRALVTSLDEGRSNVTTLRTEVGVRTNTVTAAEERQAALALNATSLLAATEDSDPVEVFTRLSQLNVGLQAAYATSARIVQSTLLDFLR